MSVPPTGTAMNQSTHAGRSNTEQVMADNRIAFGSAFTFICPACGTRAETVDSAELACPADGTRYQRVSGVWRFLTPEREPYFRPFIEDYEAIRSAEGRGALDPGYYRALPVRDLTNRFSRDWEIRRKSFDALIDQIVRPLERSTGRLRIADLGAGNCWLSNRLASRGHDVVAIDLMTNDFDGLGCHQHYTSNFTPVQAEFDRLPFAGGQFDLAIFNASFHYATDFSATLSEAMRILTGDGQIVIMDTPVYRDGSSGVEMIREREAQFEREHGLPSNRLPSEGYLTYQRMDDLAVRHGLEWELHHPGYGIRWALRPWKARILRRREPATFLLIAGRNAKDAGPRSTNRSIIRTAARLWLRGRYQLTQRHRHRNLTIEHVAGFPILVLPDVFNPALFRSGAFLAETLSDILIPAGASVLDMGAGTGVGAIAAARYASRVTTVDINPEAVRCARLNAMLNNIEERIDVRHGDLFAPIGDERFDVVLFNPPYYRGDPRDDYDRAWRSVDTVERFAAELSSHLTPTGYALVVLSSDGEVRSFLKTFREHGFTIEIAARRKHVNETMTIYRMQPDG